MPPAVCCDLCGLFPTYGYLRFMVLGRLVAVCWLCVSEELAFVPVQAGER